MKYGTRTAKLLFGVAMAASLCMPYAKTEKIPWVWGYGGGTLYYREGTTNENPKGTKWVAVETPQGLVSIAAGADGTFWAVTNDKRLLYRQSITTKNPMGTSWSYVPSEFAIFNIAVGKFDQVYAIRNIETKKSLALSYWRDGITETNPIGTRWVGIKNSDTKRAIGIFKDSVANPMSVVVSGNDVYGASACTAEYTISLNKIRETMYKLSPDKSRWLDVIGGARMCVAIDKDANVWSVDYDNHLWESLPLETPSNVLQWQPIDQSICYVAAGPAGEVWVLSTSGKILRMTGRANKIPFNVLWEDVGPAPDSSVQLTFLAIGAIEAPPAEEKPAAPAPVVSPAVSPAATEVKKVKKDTKSAAKKTAVKKQAKKK
ncbi:MAG: tectonin domain-containing protein [Candidatus Babeliales bacterium]|jgi:hypothetical protein